MVKTWGRNSIGEHVRSCETTTSRKHRQRSEVPHDRDYGRHNTGQELPVLPVLVFALQEFHSYTSLCSPAKQDRIKRECRWLVPSLDIFVRESIRKILQSSYATYWLQDMSQFMIVWYRMNRSMSHNPVHYFPFYLSFPTCHNSRNQNSLNYRVELDTYVAFAAFWTHGRQQRSPGQWRQWAPRQPTEVPPIRL